MAYSLKGVLKSNPELQKWWFYLAKDAILAFMAEKNVILYAFF